MLATMGQVSGLLVPDSFRGQLRRVGKAGDSPTSDILSAGLFLERCIEKQVLHVSGSDEWDYVLNRAIRLDSEGEVE